MPIGPGFSSVIGEDPFFFNWGGGGAGVSRMCVCEGVNYHGLIYLAFKLTSGSCFSDQAHFINTSSRLLLVVNGLVFSHNKMLLRFWEQFTSSIQYRQSCTQTGSFHPT